MKKLVLEDARSRYWEDPPDLTSLGTPAEFRALCADADRHVDIQLQYTRREQKIRFTVYSLPPDEPEDLDEAGEPDGHWEGLRWIPNTPKKDGL